MLPLWVALWVFLATILGRELSMPHTLHWEKMNVFDGIQYGATDGVNDFVIEGHFNSLVETEESCKVWELVVNDFSVGVYNSLNSAKGAV